MNPPTRQKPKHDCALRREHIRVLLGFLRLALGVGQARAGVVHWVAGLDLAVAGLHDAALGVRWRAELVWLREGVFRVGDFAVLAVVAS